MGVFGFFASKGFRQYEILEQVDDGEMSSIYKARHRRQGIVVALKILKRDAVRLRQAVLRRFPEVNERLLAISHEKIARYHEIGESRLMHYIVVEFVQGLTLASIAKRRVAGLSKLVAYFLQVASALKYLHEETRLVHRDFNHHNVIVNEADSCKLIDLDFAFPIAKNTRGIFRRSGTLGYLAPEQVRGKALDQRVDIYAFGASLYESLAGFNPFRDTSQQSKELRREKTLTNHLYLTPLPPGKTNSRIPPLLDELVLRCLELSPSERPQSMAEVESTLKEIATGLG